VQAVDGASLLGERTAAGKVVSMHMGIDHVGDLHILFRCFLEEPQLVTQNGIDGDADMA